MKNISETFDHYEYRLSRMGDTELFSDLTKAEKAIPNAYLTVLKVLFGNKMNARTSRKQERP